MTRLTGFERAGQRVAAILTLLSTAKLNGLNPAAWLKETLEKLPIWPNSRIDELLTAKADSKEKKGSDHEMGLALHCFQYSAHGRIDWIANAQTEFEESVVGIDVSQVDKVNAKNRP